MPPWFEQLSRIVVLLSIASALIVAADLFVRPQKMWIMDLVWPLTALYAGPLGLVAYWYLGRSPGEGQKSPEKPFWATALVGSTHCGAGCALGDFLSEWVAFAIGFSIFGSRLLGKFALGFAFAYGIGIFFQFFSIAPMRGLGPVEGLWAAVKADTLSLVAYEIGMFGWMAVTQLLLFPGLEPTSWTFWLMMQIAMLLGLATTYPVNWLLIRTGVKEAM